MEPKAKASMQVGIDIFPNPVAVLEVGGEGRIVMVNATGARYLKPDAEAINFAYTQDELDTWENGWMTPSGNPLNKNETPAKRLNRGECFSQWELMWHNALTNRTYHALLYGNVLPATSDHCKVGLMSFMDITSEVRQREQLKGALLMRDDFVRVASHELRTPLTSVALALHIIIDSHERGQRFEYNDLVGKLKVIDRGVKRLTYLVNNLLDVSEILAPKEMRFTEVNLCEVVRGVIEAQELPAKNADVKIISDVPKETIKGLWDRGRLAQIITNLVNNAIKYGRGRPVEVSVTLREKHVEVKVRDYGIGVRLEDRERIFRRYERVASSYEYGGMGLGLWLAKESARVMGGSLWVEEPPCGGAGAVFILHLPC